MRQYALISVAPVTLWLMVCVGCASTPPRLGVHNGALAPCRHKSNCVNSQEHGYYSYVSPIIYNGTMEEARARLLSILEKTKRTKIVVSEPDYIRAECTSAVFRFVDDLEFYFPPEEKIIHVRSGARVGHADFRVNLRRVEKIRKQF